MTPETGTKVGCPYLKMSDTEEEYLCTVQGILLSKIDALNLCLKRGAWQKCYAYNLAKAQGKKKTESLSADVIQHIKQRLMSNIEIDILKLAEELHVLPLSIKEEIDKYNRSKEFIGITTRRKIIPIREFISMIKNIGRVGRGPTLEALSRKLDIDREYLIETLFLLVTKGYLR